MVWGQSRMIDQTFFETIVKLIKVGSTNYEQFFRLNESARKSMSTGFRLIILIRMSSLIVFSTVREQNERLNAKCQKWNAKIRARAIFTLVSNNFRSAIQFYPHCLHRWNIVESILHQILEYNTWILYLKQIQYERRCPCYVSVADMLCHIKINFAWFFWEQKKIMLEYCVIATQTDRKKW